MVAVDAHSVAAVWQNHFSAGLQADPTLIFSLQVHIWIFPLILRFLPDNHLHAIIFLLSNFKLWRVTVETLKRWQYNSCSYRLEDAWLTLDKVKKEVSTWLSRKRLHYSTLISMTSKFLNSHGCPIKQIDFKKKWNHIILLY